MANSFKLTDKVTTHLPEHMAIKLRNTSTQAGCNESELLRDMICLHLEGLTFGEYVANSRREALHIQGAKQVQHSAQSSAQTPALNVPYRTDQGADCQRHD